MDGERNNFLGTYLRDAVYGASDGIVTTFAIVAGVAGASLAPEIVLILGFANLLADGFSMAAANYNGTKSEQEYFASKLKSTEKNIELNPENGRIALRKVYHRKGFTGILLESIVAHISKDKHSWTTTLVEDDLGPMESLNHPAKNATITFISFVIAGFMPLLAYVLARFISVLSSFMFEIAIVMTALTLVLVGLLKSKITKVNPMKEALQMLFIGGFAAGVAYLIGLLLSSLI